MRKNGFTVIELLVVIVIVGVMAAMVYPKMNDAVRHESVRSARRETITQLARAKATAVQRGCRSTLQMRADPGRVWIESCKVTGSGRDTVGPISHLQEKYKLRVTTTADSVPFSPTSLGLGLGSVTMTFARSGYTLALDISAVGKPTW